MGKFRSKLKGKTKGKRWLKGQSSNSNPKTQKYREMAKSRFFQENLGNKCFILDIFDIVIVFICFLNSIIFVWHLLPK